MAAKCIGLLLTSLVSPASAEPDVEAALAQDSECSATDRACALHALQLKATRRVEDPESMEGADLVSARRDFHEALLQTQAENGWGHWKPGWNYTLYNGTETSPRDGVQPPSQPLQYNGMSWPTMDVDAEIGAESHFFAIGDWGGMDGEMEELPEGFARMVMYQGSDEPGPHVFPRSRMGCAMGPLTSCMGGGHCKSMCGFAKGIDDRAQILVAEAMMKRAQRYRPVAILNVGDNFYWGGIAKRCGSPMDKIHPVTKHQFDNVYENVYGGSLKGIPWFSVLGNHDWGGREFTAGWDQQIAYTWASDRWRMPALYWHQKMNFPDYSIDFLMVDTNANDAGPPSHKPGSNVCSFYNDQLNPGASCASAGGPANSASCAAWFSKLWADQEPWIENLLSQSEADWQVIVTHFPCEKHPEYWKKLHQSYGLDLLVTGHKHDQELWKGSKTALPASQLGGLTCFVTGGGGGITSEESPLKNHGMSHAWPNVNTQYGFFDMAVSKEKIRLESLDHTGRVVDHTTVYQKHK